MDQQSETKIHPIPQSERSKKLGRRIFLERVAAAAVASGISSKLGIFSWISSQFSSSTPPSAENPPAKEINFYPQVKADSPGPVATETKTPETSQVNLLGEIGKSKLGSPKRLELETKYCQSVKTLEDIDRGLEWVNDEILRGHLIKKRWGRREAGDNQLTRLTDQQVEWSLKHNIYPEILAGCLDQQKNNLFILETILKSERSNFRPDLAHKVKIGDLPQTVLDNLTAPNLLINAGGLAELTCRETTGAGGEIEFKGKSYSNLRIGLTKIGRSPAIYNLNQEKFGASFKALPKIANDIKAETGIEVDIDNIPGSVPFEGHPYGGAIGPQMMPQNIQKLNDLYRKYPEIVKRVKFNPFNYSSSYQNMAIFLAIGEEFVEKNEEIEVNGKKHQVPLISQRYGYLNGVYPYKIVEGGKEIVRDKGRDIRLDAIKKWGNDQNQAEGVISAADSYSETFPI